MYGEILLVHRTREDLRAVWNSSSALTFNSLRIAVSLMLRKWFLTVMNDLSSLVIGDFLEVVVFVSVDDSQPVNKLSVAVRIIGHRKALDICFLFTGPFRLQSESISYHELFDY